MENKSGLHPAGRAVLLRMYEPNKGLRTNLIAIPQSVREKSDALEHRGIVVEVGANCWHDEPSPRAKAGDHVLVTKFAGFIARGTQDRGLYRLVNDRDIFCTFEPEADVASFEGEDDQSDPMGVAHG